MPGPSLTVWYNTRCPVCDAGIDWQRNKLLAAVRSGTIAFEDINERPDALAGNGATVDDVRRRLHATDESGRLIVGADVAARLAIDAGRRLACRAAWQSRHAAGDAARL
jgi:predicted DCC family thiol-disulfide oxidoreductase YuxK